jgi:hypothetical protein
MGWTDLFFRFWKRMEKGDNKDEVRLAEVR